MYTMQLYKWLQMCYNNVTNVRERSSIFLKFAIVDADNNLRRLISLALNRVYPNANVLQFQDGKTALQALKTQPIDALLCALALPELDGPACWRQSDPYAIARALWC